VSAQDLRHRCSKLGQKAGEDLGLISRKVEPNILVSGYDCKNGVSPGFDNSQYKFPRASKTTKLDLALFEFSQAVKVDTVKVDTASGTVTQIWVAACDGEPDFGKGLVDAIGACRVNNSDGTPGKRHIHQIGWTGVRYLLVRARPNRNKPNANALGRTLAVFSADVFIEAIDFTK